MQPLIPVRWAAAGLVVVIMALLSTTYIFPAASSKQKEIPPSNLKIIDVPHVKILYCYSCGYRKAFDEYAKIIQRKYPHLTVIGDNYPPKPIRHYLAMVINTSKIFVILVLWFLGNPFERLGFATPWIWERMLSNKIYSSLLLFLTGNMIEANLISTGAFEIYYNDTEIWSKLATDRVPSQAELFDLIDNHNLVRADLNSFRYK